LPALYRTAARGGFICVVEARGSNADWCDLCEILCRAGTATPTVEDNRACGLGA
jgi:hypothetical protein